LHAWKESRMLASCLRNSTCAGFRVTTLLSAPLIATRSTHHHRMIPILHEHNMIESSNSQRKKRIAIVGSGCSGIGALYALKRTHHEVHLYEANSRLGGHTNTVPFKDKNGDEIQVDTGFIIANTVTYRQSQLQPSPCPNVAPI
jgi:hypothetical protein